MSTAWPGGAELPTEPVGSLPRPSVLQRAVLDAEIGQISAAELERAQDAAVRDTLDRFAETGSPLVSDGEQRRQSFSSYPLGTSPHDGGVEVGPVFAVFADGHHRVIPSLASGPFRFRGWAADDVARSRELTSLPLKQAVISPSMLSLMVPAEGLGDYSRAEFLDDVVAGCAEDIRRCFAAGASRVSIDFTEGTSALPSWLAANGIRTVIITGTLSNCCCESTARDAMQYGYEVIYVADANATLSDAEHGATLVNMATLFADVATTGEVLSRLG